MELCAKTQWIILICLKYMLKKPSPCILRYFYFWTLKSLHSLKSSYSSSPPPFSFSFFFFFLSLRVCINLPTTSQRRGMVQKQRRTLSSVLQLSCGNINNLVTNVQSFGKMELKFSYSSLLSMGKENLSWESWRTSLSQFGQCKVVKPILSWGAQFSTSQQRKCKKAEPRTWTGIIA